MALVICHHQGWYNLYTTIADGFYFEEPLTFEQLQEWTKEEYGNAGLKALPARLERAHVHGTSHNLIRSLEDMLSLNRAGENEEHLSVQECIDRFLAPKRSDD